LCLLPSLSLALYLLHNRRYSVTRIVGDRLSPLIECPIRYFAVIEIRSSPYPMVERLGDNSRNLWRIGLLAPKLSDLKTFLVCSDQVRKGFPFFRLWK
jgi:hypothetical protein